MKGESLQMGEKKIEMQFKMSKEKMGKSFRETEE